MWGSAPELLAVTKLAVLYEIALASRGAIQRDIQHRKVVARLRAIDGVQRIPALHEALLVLERQRQSVRAIADRTLDTCGLLRQWQAAGWERAASTGEHLRRAGPPPGLNTSGWAAPRTRRPPRGPQRGSHAHSAASRLKQSIEYPESDFANCDDILAVIDPDSSFCG